jgi:hypothetical protein
VDFQQGASAAAPRLVRDKFGVCQRRRYRYKIHSLSYVNIDESNGGVIHNLNEAGLCVQAVSPLQKDQQIQLRFELPSPRIRIHSTARVRWTNAAGLAGLEFTGLNPRSSQLMKDWLLTQLLVRGQRLFVTHSMFAERPPTLPHAMAETAGESTSITASPQALLSGLITAAPDASRAGFWAFMVDSAAILAAVLLFSVIAIGMMQTLPNWAVCAFVTLMTAAILTVVYWFIFTSWKGLTPGNYLAAKIFRLEETLARGEERTRFR